MQTHEVYLPSPAEIASATAKIRESWSEEEHHRRAGRSFQPCPNVPAMHSQITQRGAQSAEFNLQNLERYLDTKAKECFWNAALVSGAGGEDLSDEEFMGMPNHKRHEYLMRKQRVHWRKRCRKPTSTSE